jgi:hypothetical protein
MPLRRPLIRLGIVGTACWVAFWVWHYATTCSLVSMAGGRAITCRWETAEAGGVAVATRTAPALTVLWDMAARTIGIPGCIIVAALAVYWVTERFRRAAP